MEERKLIKRKEKAIAERNQEHLASACSDFGDYYYQHGKYEEAAAEYQQEAKIRDKLGQRLEMAKAHRMLSEIYMLLSEFDNALKHVNIYLKNVQNLKNKVEEQRAFATLGRVYLLQGQSLSDLPSAQKPLKSAEKAFIKSLLICKELSGHISKIELLDMQARLYLNIGVVKEHMEDFEEAISYLEKAIKIANSNDIYELLHLCYTSASLLYHYKKNDVAVALRFCNLALEVSQRLPNRTKKECETLITKSEIMIKMGDFQSAKQVLHKAYKLKTPDLNDKDTIEKTLKIVAALCYTLDSLVTISSTDYRGKKDLYEKMGDGCCLLQNYSKAIDYYLKMLECVEMCRESDRELIPVYVSLYQTYKDNKQYDHALEYLWKELELNKNEPTEAFNTLCNIGEIYELQLKPFWTTQEIYQKAMEEAKKAGKERLEKVALVRLMKLQEKFNMNTLLDELKDEAIKRGLDLRNINEDDSESETASQSEQNTPDIGHDICLDDLTDSEAEVEETEKSRTTRKRGTCLTIKRNNKGETQLHQACISGNLTLARRLIDQGHAVNIRDHAGWLPLHEACNHGHRDIVELLLDRGAMSAINDKGGTSCDGITPLYDACSNGFLDVVELLLERGANATLRTDFGDAALNVLDKWRNSVELDACEQLQYETVRSMISHQLSKAGIDDSMTLKSPITNENCTKNSGENSRRRKLETFAYENESSDSGDELRHSRGSNRSLNRSNRSKHSLCDDEQFDDYSRSCNALREPNLTRENESARSAYINVMKSVKHPNRKLNTDDTSEQLSKRKSGFLEPDEVGDEWLENDIRPTKKKTKYLNERVIFGEEGKRGNEASPAKQNLDFLLSEDSQDAFEILLGSRNKHNKQKIKPIKSQASTSSRRILKRQSSLLDSGFCRFRSESPLTNEDSSGDKSIEPDSTTPYASSRDNEEPVAAMVTQVVSFKIRVGDELLLVPVERKKIAEANIRWLAEEAARRYYKLVGLKPVIRLMTADGFAFEETDSISVALEQNMISSKVLEWKISPIPHRYEEMCAQLHMDCDVNVKVAMEKAQVSNSAVFRDLYLTAELSEPVFKAILHQTSLRVLDLSNNFIQNEGVKQLAKSLPTLKQLRALNLEGNGITHEGIEILATSLSTCADPMELEDLCLSFNPIGNQGIRSLEKICNKIPNLRKLYLSSCYLTDFYQYDLNFHDLTHIDVSFNKLEPECFKVLLGKLNSCRMQYFNINFTVTEKALADKINEFFESGTCEKFKRVELAGCQLIDSNIYNIVEHLSKAQDLEVINLIENSKLTAPSLQYILEYMPHVKKVLLQQCPQIMKSCSFSNFNINSGDKFPELIALTTPTDDFAAIDELKCFWEQRYGAKGKVNYCCNNVVLYVNDCDLADI